jgi:undecaprenyl-diphosphatase
MVAWERRAVGAAITGLVIFALISLLVHLGLLRSADATVMEMKQAMTSEALRKWSGLVAVVFSAELSVVYGLVGVVLLYRSGMGRWSLAPYAFLAALAVEVAMKIVLYQPRVPGEYVRPSDYPLTYVNLPWSFPSGHAIRTGFFLVFLAVLLWSRGGRMAKAVSLGLVALILPVSYARVYMGQHWASDVVAGLALGISIALLVAPPVAKRL